MLGVDRYEALPAPISCCGWSRPMVCDTEHIECGDNIVNTSASYESVNDTTNAVETATNYYTIQTVWQNGM